MFDFSDPSQSGRPAALPLPVRGEQGARLDGVAERGAGAVRLDQVHVGGGDARVRQCLADHVLLGAAVGCGQAVAGPVLVDGGAAQDGEHGVAGLVGRRTAAPGGARRRLRPSRSRPLRRRRPCTGRRRMAAPCRENSTKNEGVAITDAPPARASEHSPDRSDCAASVEGHQRRRAGGVHRHGGPGQAQFVGDAAGRDAQGAAVQQVALQFPLSRLQEPPSVLGRAHA